MLAKVLSFMIESILDCKCCGADYAPKEVAKEKIKKMMKIYH
jgi:hypothetical protein